MSTMQDANEFLMTAGDGLPTIKLENVGDKVTWTILSADVRNATDPDGTLKKFPDGNPMKQLVLVVRLEDGSEARYFCSNGARVAIREALETVEATGIDSGSELVLLRLDDAPPKVRGHSGAHQFKAKYTPPSKSVSASDLL